MKKFIALVSALLIVVLSLAACGDSEPTPKTFNGSTKDVDLKAVMDKINTQFDLGESRDVSDSARYYGVSAEDCKQFYAQKPQKDRELNEIVICELATPDAIDRVTKKFEASLGRVYNDAKSYGKDDLAIVENSSVIVDGKYIYLVISPYANEINALIKSELN